jgi:L-amino acid N-acyltransferase YncA
MKTAYELAMERLEKASGPTRKLSNAQKARIAEIEKIYDAKIAETKLASESEMLSADSMEALNQLKQGLADAIASIEERREKEKEAVWNAK